MLDFLVSLLIKEKSYLRVGNLIHRNLELVEFFDQVLVASDESKLCLFKVIDGKDVEEIEATANYGRDIILQNSPSRISRFISLVFLIAEEGIDEETAEKLKKLEPFTRDSCLAPVIIDCKTQKFYCDYLRTPISFLPLLNYLKAEIEKFSPGEITSREVENLDIYEIQTAVKLESFRKILVKTTPIITWAFIAINVTIWLLMEIWGNSNDPVMLIKYGAKVGPLIWQGQLFRLISPAFLHITFLHLFSNCVVIYFLGPILESVLGKGRLIFVYLFAGIMGNLLSLRFSPYLSAGASSAVFGLLGALLVYGRRYRNDIPSRFYTVTTIYLVPFLLYNFIIGFWYPNVDNYAHLGGFLGGMLAGLVLGVNYPANLPRKIRFGPVILTSAVFGLMFMTGMQPYQDAYKVYYLIRGNSAAVRGDLIESVSYLNMSLKIDPAYRDARQLAGKVYANLGFSLMKKNQFTPALDFLTKSVKYISIKNSNYEILSAAYEGMGICQDEKYNNHEAITNFKKALIFSPENRRIKNEISQQYYILASRYQVQNCFEKAQYYAEKSIEYFKDNVHSYLLLGKIYYYQAEFPKAALIWKKASKISPEDLRAEHFLENFIFKNLWYPHRENYVGEKPDPKAFELNWEGVKILVDSGNYKRAREKFKSAQQISPGYVSPGINQSRIEIILGNLESARQILKKILSRQPGNWNALSHLAAIYILNGDLQQAELILKQCVKLKPDYAYPYSLLGEIYNKKGEYSDSIKNLEKSVELYPSNALWQLKLALTYREARKEKLFHQRANTAISYAFNQQRLHLELTIRTILGAENSNIVSN